MAQNNDDFWWVAAVVGLAGAIIGGLMDNDEEQIRKAAQEKQARRVRLLFDTVYSMAAKMAKADGAVSREEIDQLTSLMKDTMKLDADGQKEAIRIFNEAKNAATTIEEYARRFYAEYANEPESLTNMLMLLFYVAAADDILHPAEERMLQAVAQIFKISEAAYKEIKVEFFGNTEYWYAILRCTPNDDDDTIRKQYRKLALEYHPDRMASQNLSATQMADINKQFQQINEAYEAIRKIRGFK